MVESLVQWTLLNNPNFLSQILNFDISKIIGQEITTDFGRIDFVLANNQNRHLVVELETELNYAPKLEYCFNQTLNYKNVRFSNLTNYCILYAEETIEKNKRIIDKFGKENNVLIQTYSLETAKKLYSKTIERMSLNIGLAFTQSEKLYNLLFTLA